MVGIIKIVFVIFLIVFVLYLISKKYGVEKVFSKALKIVPPICIILFYVGNISIIEAVFNTFNITNAVISNNPSIKVAIDSAIVTLVLNLIFEFFGSPVHIRVLSRSSDNTDIVVLKGDKGRLIYYNVEIDYRKPFYRRLFDRNGGVVLRIYNTQWTSIQIDNETQYGQVVDSGNSSKYIDINLGKISQHSKKMYEKLYLRLTVSLKKDVDLNDEIISEVLFPNSKFNKFIWMFCELDYNSIVLQIRGLKND